ncbi:CotH kinase family protein [bacterium]
MRLQQITSSNLKSVLCFVFLFSFIFHSKLSHAKGLYDNQSAPVFNEIMASNATSIQDRDGDYPDWIEIYHSGDTQVDLTGYGLSDDPNEPFKWVFPTVILQPEEFKLVFASDKDYLTENPYLHTNFKLKAGGETLLLTDTTGFVVDQITSLEITSDLSWGRQPDGGSDWLFFTEPTPGTANHGTGFTAFSSPVTFSKSGGFYQSNVSIELTTDSPTAEIRYTLDGSEPQQNSSLYTEAIQLGRTTVIRARSFEAGLLPGETVTHTYFINEETNLPVISLSTDPANLFDQRIGIYTNYKQDWERPVHFEFYETDGSQKVNVDGGIKIGGGATRGRPQKAFHINFRGRYGATKIEHQIFPDCPVYEFDTLFLRAAGNDWDQTHFRDALLQTLVRDLDFDTQAYRPAVIFLNGAYWGILNIRERFTKGYLASHHGPDPENVDLLELAHPNNFISVIEGDLDRFSTLYETIQNNDFTDDVYYETIQTQMDISSFLDYVISEIYFNNTDWPTNNVKFWRPRTETGKFRWMLFDLDWSTGYQRTRVGLADPNTYKGNTLTWALGTDQMHIGLMLRKFFENDRFKTEFINRFADYLNTVFHPDHVHALIAKTQENLEPEMPNHYHRFKSVPISEWYKQITIMENFATYRPSYIREHIRNYFGLTKTVQLNVQMTPASSGSIQLNHILIKEDAWQGEYFTNVPIQLTASPNIGYRFTGWTGDVETDSVTMKRTLSEDILITAHFEIDETATTGIVINEINYHSADEFDPGDWLELYNITENTVDISGWKLLDENESTGFRIPSNTVVAPNDYVVLCQDVEEFSQLFPEIKNAIGDLGFGLNNAGELIRLTNSDGILVDSVAYDDASPWPVQPDGKGPALMLRDPQLDNSSAQNWMSSNKYGTPGKENRFLNVSVESAIEIPKEFQLNQNFPNPYNQATVISYQLSAVSRVKVEVFDVLGREIAVLVNEIQEAGPCQIHLEMNQFASGLYFYRLQAGSEFSEIKKMILIR